MQCNCMIESFTTCLKLKYVFLCPVVLQPLMAHHQWLFPKASTKTKFDCCHHTSQPIPASSRVFNRDIGCEFFGNIIIDFNFKYDERFLAFANKLSSIKFPSSSTGQCCAMVSTERFIYANVFFFFVKRHRQLEQCISLRILRLRMASIFL